MNNFWPVKVLRFVTLFFVFAIALGMWLYPGGNIHDPEQLGYSFTHNFLSDLGGYQSHSDEVNFLSSFLFNLGMFLFIAVGIGFIFVRRLFSQNKVSNILATIGSVFFFIGTVFFAGVGLTPYDLYLELHVFFAVNAFRLLVPGAFLYVLVLFRSKVSNRFALVTMAYLACVLSLIHI